MIDPRKLTDHELNFVIDHERMHLSYAIKHGYDSASEFVTGVMAQLNAFNREKHNRTHKLFGGR